MGKREGFIAYVGSELTEQRIQKLLKKVADKKYQKEKVNRCVNVKSYGNAIFGQLVGKYSDDEAEPYIFVKNGNETIYCASYDFDELDMLLVEWGEKYKLNSSKTYCRFPYLGPGSLLIEKLFAEYGVDAFKMIQERSLSLNFVIYDMKYEQLTAARTGESNLFYGFTYKNHEIIFSDYEEIVQEVCGFAYRFPQESYYQDGVFRKYNYKKERLTQKTLLKMIKQGFIEAFEELEENSTEVVLDEDAYKLFYYVNSLLEDKLDVKIVEKTKKL